MSDWLLPSVVVLVVLAYAEFVSLRFWQRQYQRERAENSALRALCVSNGLAIQAYLAIDRAHAELEAAE